MEIEPSDQEQNSIALFEAKSVRRLWHESKWYFSIIDVVEILTDSPNPRNYWSMLKRKLKTEGAEQLYTNSVQLKMQSTDGKKYLTDAADTETLLRIIQSIPSPKAEPFKRWLAQVGTERIAEIANPELAMERAKAIYEAKGYPQDWITKRMQSITVRNSLTHEWSERGASIGKEYAILTNDIARATFGIDTVQHKTFKKLKKDEPLRDHMTDMELILTMLGEAATTKIHQSNNSQGFMQLQGDAKKGGKVAGNARKELEAETGVHVISPENFHNPKSIE